MKKIVSLVVLILLAATLIYVFDYESFVAHTEDTGSQSKPISPVEQSQVLDEKLGLMNKKNEAQKKSSKEEKKLQQENVTFQWLENRGYNFDSSSYAGLSIESLRTMAESGDSYAQSALAEKLLLETNYTESPEERLRYSDDAKKWYLETVIGGNSYNIGNLIQIHSLAVADRKDVVALELSEPIYGHKVEAMAWSKVAKIRNDPLVEFGSGKNFGDLSLEEKEKINKRSREIYSFLVEARKKRGLGEFDNSMPQEVREYFRLN